MALPAFANCDVWAVLARFLAAGPARGDGWGTPEAWLADFAVNYRAKGRLVYVEGRLQTRTWDAADRTKRRTVEIAADRFQALSSRRPEAPAA